MSLPDTSSNLLEGENAVEMRTKENVRSLRERFSRRLSAGMSLWALVSCKQNTAVQQKL